MRHPLVTDRFRTNAGYPLFMQEAGHEAEMKQLRGPVENSKSAVVQAQTWVKHTAIWKKRRKISATQPQPGRRT